MALYEIKPERATLHGHFSRDLPPRLTIQSGDTVRFQTLEAAWTTIPRRTNDPNEEQSVFVPRDPKTDGGHALCGPIFVQGAEPGMTLEVRIDTVLPDTWGYVYAGGWETPLNDRLGVSASAGVVHNWALDPQTMTARSRQGFLVKMRPFLGVMGMPEDVPGIQPTFPPRRTGGNLDCKELTEGSSLFLPIAVPGGLFSAGDGHAAQGDGEVSGLAIECPMARVDLTFHLHPNLSLTLPRAETPAGKLTLGFGETLDEAMGNALDAMLDWMGEIYGLSRPDALALASVAVDLCVTQVVNGVQGVHALLPHGALLTEK
jgi:acetamidase/formamidase